MVIHVKVFPETLTEPSMLFQEDIQLVEAQIMQKKLYARETFRVETKRPRRNPTPVISFSDDDFMENMIEGHQDAPVITAKIGTNNVKKILIDNGSSVDILYYGAYSKMDLGDRKIDSAKTTPLYGFTGNEVKVVGTSTCLFSFVLHLANLGKLSNSM